MIVETSSPDADVVCVVHQMKKPFNFELQYGEGQHELDVAIFYESTEDENHLISFEVDGKNTPVPYPPNEDTYPDVGEELHTAIFDWVSENVPPSKDMEDDGNKIFETVWDWMYENGLV